MMKIVVTFFLVIRVILIIKSILVIKYFRHSHMSKYTKLNH